MVSKLFSYKGAKPVLTLLVLLTILQGITIIIQGYYLAEAISSLFRGDLFHSVTKELLIFIAAIVCRQLLTVSKNNLSFHFAARTSMDIRERFLKKLFQLGPRFVREMGSGQTVTLVMEGIAKFRTYLELYFQKVVNAVFIPVIVCLFVFKENFKSGLILVLTFPIMIIFMILLGKAAKSKADRQFVSYRLLSNYFVDSLRGLETLKYLGLSRHHSKKIAYVSEMYRKETIATLRIAFLSSFALDFFTMLSIATVAVFLGFGLINGTVNLQTALTILILAPEFFLPIKEAGADYHTTLDGKNAEKKIQEILGLDMNLPKQEVLPVWDTSSTFSINGLGVRYEDSEEQGLKNIEISVTGSKKIGIIGTSGSGKSTLIEVLSGFLEPSCGEFMLNNKKLSSLGLHDWQKQLIYIPQQPYIFQDTVLNNIRFYLPEATREEVEEAIIKSGLAAVVEDLPQGLETLIGDGGRILSGGQEQRIALARSFLGNRPILLLDEPTAHLDIETEAELKETMIRLFENKLVFFATHRLHWMAEMDEILVLNHGEIIESGTHDELLQMHGFYYQLIQTQMGENL